MIVVRENNRIFTKMPFFQKTLEPRLLTRFYWKFNLNLKQINLVVTATRPNSLIGHNLVVTRLD